RQRPRGPGPVAPGDADLRPHRVRERREPGQGRVHHEGGLGGAAGDPHRHRLRGAVRGRGAEAARGGRHPDPPGLDAVRGVVRRGGEVLALCRRLGRSSGARPARSCPAPAPRPPLPRPAVTGFPESPQGRIGPSPALSPTTAVRHRAHTPGRNDMAQNTHTQALSDAGVSIWLDDLSRERMDSGNLQELVDTRNVVGVTTNPSIFQSAISGRSEYDADIARLAGEGKDVDAIVEVLTTDDVRRAADLLAGVHTATHGVDGRVSIEVDPRLA